ncbi:MAG: energy transducer TonB [Chlorobi bacterium]|nr:energy transducer TonB [Chlorobiota bacterium]
MIVLIGFISAVFLTFGALLVVAVLIGVGIRYLMRDQRDNEPLAEARSIDQYQKLALRLGFVMTFLALLFLFNFKVYEKLEVNEPPIKDPIAHYVIDITPPPTKHVKPPEPKPEPEQPKKDRLEKIKIDNLPDATKKEDMSDQLVDSISVMPLPPEPVPDPDDGKDRFFLIVSQMPEFPGGEEALLDFMYKNFNYPDECAEMGIAGQIVVQFIVERDGSVSTPRVLRGLDCAEANEEALRVVSIMPRWKPGMQQGRPVRVLLSLPIKVKVR